MSNRFQNEMAIDKKTENMLIDMPNVVSDWYYNMTAARKSSRSKNEYIKIVKRFIDFLDGINVADIKERDVSRYMTSISRKVVMKNGVEEYKKTSDSYLQTTWSALNAFFKYAESTGNIKKNPMKTICRPSKHDEPERYYLTAEDFQRIIDNAKRINNMNKRGKHKKYANRDVLILMLFMNTGMRRTALSEIDIDDIDLENRTLTIIDKREKTHLYYLQENVMNLIYDWLNDRSEIIKGKDEKALFISRLGNRLSSQSIYEMVEKYTSAALGYNLSPHKLRAGFCTILYDKTKDIKFVSKAVGHADIATTQIYVQTDKNDQFKASKIMEGVFD